MNKLGINRKDAYDYELMHINPHIFHATPSIYQQAYVFYKSLKYLIEYSFYTDILLLNSSRSKYI